MILNNDYQNLNSPVGKEIKGNFLIFFFEKFRIFEIPSCLFKS